jgi:hypothetical protein
VVSRRAPLAVVDAENVGFEVDIFDIPVQDFGAVDSGEQHDHE